MSRGRFVSSSTAVSNAMACVAARAFLAASLLLLAFFGGGCARNPSADESARAAASSAASSLPFLQKIPDAPSSVAYSGERHVRLSFVVAGTPRTLEYDETVHSDGHGRFAIIPGKVTSPEMSADEAEFFAILQERRDGFFYRYRDFRIRDWNAFLRNWSAKDLGTREPVAGRDCAVLEFRRIPVSTGPGPDSAHAGQDDVDGGGRYRAWVDTANGLVLRAEEYDAGGTRVGLVEFQGITLAPDLSNVALHADRSAPKILDLEAGTKAALGFEVLRPKILPDGYRLERAESVSADAQSGVGSGAGSGADERWARLAYGDGVEEIFFLQGLSPEAAQASTSPAEADVGTRFVRVFRVGPWTVLQGQFDRTRAVVMGKVSEASLLRMLKSAIH